MTIGMIGAGAVARAFARYLVAEGHEVLLSNRHGVSSLAEVVRELGGKARAVTREEAAAAEVVVLAVRWTDIPAALAGLPPWNGRILIDTTNQFIGQGKLEDLHGRVSSVMVAELAPGARVVKTLNTLYVWRFEQGPHANGGRRVVCLAGDDPEAKSIVSGLIAPAGFHLLDLGTLATGGRLMQAGGQIAGTDLVVHDSRSAK